MRRTPLNFPRRWLEPSMASLEGSTLDPLHYGRLGVAVLRGAVSRDAVASWQGEWDAFVRTSLSRGRRINRFNPVALQESVPSGLASIHAHPALVQLMRALYPNLGLYMQRILVKDASARGPVFLHQDCGYDHGWLDKTSVFLPLTRMTPEGGGLRLYPGTHHLGYLGDAGELDVEALEPGWPVVTPTLEPGDVVLMHECTWHASGPHLTGPDRVLVQMTYQSAADPSSTVVLHREGEPDPRSELGLGAFPREHLFVRSRSSRLRELQRQVDPKSDS